VAARGLAEVTALAERCLLAGLSDALPTVMRVLADRAALDTDVGHLAEALPALVRALRYGDVRGTDTGALTEVAAGLAERIFVGLPPACVSLDTDAADAMLTRLGELLRHALRSDPRHETPLREELELLDQYLDIMRTRFGDRLTIRRTIPTAVESALVPTFVLQPLVENALEHGVRRMHGPGCVEIEARREDDTLVLSVRDNGSGEQGMAREGLGIGLANTRARLQALHGSAAELRLAPRANGGMEAALRLPLRFVPER